jgi:hypothetical protein
VAAWIAPLVALTLAAAFHTMLGGYDGEADRGMWTEDLPVAIGVGAIMASLIISPPSFSGELKWERLLDRPLRLLGLMTLATVVIAWVGHKVAFDSFAYSRDEDLALFQAALISKGKLIGQAPEAWRPFAKAIQDSFMVDVPGNGGYWLSGYLPVNSALQAIGVALKADGVVSPVLAGVSLVATYAVGRRLWPERPRAALMAAGLLFTSSQFLVMAMTPYAMTAHLALNTVWLWLFLRGGRLGHAGALLMGFLATGLHQLIFHPLFAAPFVLDLWLRRRWRLAALYTGGYAAIGLFWVVYWSLVLRSVGVDAHHAGTLGGTRLVREVIDLVGAFRGGYFGVMAKSLVRFITWQHVATVPLVLLGSYAALRAGGAQRNLLFGVLLTLVAILVLLPAQGTGWGYRYFHSLLGSAALLATEAWLSLTAGLRPPDRREATLTLGVLTAATVFLIPFRAWQAHRVIHPYVLATRQIERTKADVVLITEPYVWLPRRLVRNDPDLARRPITIPLPVLSRSELVQLCATHKIALFETSDAARFGIPTAAEPPGQRFARERETQSHIVQLGCTIEPWPWS